jgi:alpha-L-fucosidase
MIKGSKIRLYLILLIFIFYKITFAQEFYQRYPKYNRNNTNIRSSVFNNNYRYKKPTDTLVATKLAEWRKLKFGLFMHWGTYTEWNIIESWTLCSEPSQTWISREGPYSEDYDAYKTAYENLQHSFNPYLFNPDNWALAAKNAGMKYVVFTVKHHDGFCMYNSSLTNYNISDTSCPFHTNPKNNISKEIFDSFRSMGFFIGEYYSKADWYCRDYWWKAFATSGTSVNYPPLIYPQKWSNFVQYTHSQINEMMTTLGRIDILWLDASWVTPSNYNQDIQMGQIASIARSAQPGLIMVNRYGGEYEDYLTPEGSMPEEPINNPWELCVPIGIFWAHINEDSLYFKSTDSLIHLLAEVAGKGGNLLLNISPDKTGQWHYKAFTRLQEIGNWININGSAIYETVNTMPYRDNNIFFTAKEDTVFAIYLKNDNQTTMPSQISWHSHLPRSNSNVYLLGYPYPLYYNISSNAVNVFIPTEIQNNPPCRHAWVFKIVTNEIPYINQNKENKISDKYTLYQNYPNPFNSSTIFKFDLPSFHNRLKSPVQLKIYDILGREVKTLINENLSSGSYNITFDAKEFASGIYFFKLTTGDFSNTRKMTIVK